ncbi:cyanophycinase [Piscinibacter sp. XHJ-5]|uniref:cyanophycinase n=1 Tax=Piscinibacter sp. XHJ-5 TaxID=3037797 RepID=UPI002453737A|nr:cyanophycinase [Piscinibacter sp. XHJ-5]
MPRQPRKKTQRHGHLFIIGGAEDREEDKLVLSRFVDLAGGRKASIAVLTAASNYHDEVWKVYNDAFRDLGVTQCAPVVIDNREQANDEVLAKAIYDADAVFMTGGDQVKLLSLIGGTRLDHAMHCALRERGTCIAGTSAGASAMSEHMLYESGPELQPIKGSVRIAAGLGFMRRVVIDQHFSERKRIGRLLSVVAQNPYLLGAGIDENTALIVEPGLGLEVIGEGAVTILDGREMLTSFLDEDRHQQLELTNVKLHLMPAGARYYFDAKGQGPQTRTSDGRMVPIALYDVVAAVASSSDAPLAAPLAA